MGGVAAVDGSLAHRQSFFRLLRGSNHMLLGFTGLNPREEELRSLLAAIEDALQSYRDLLDATLVAPAGAKVPVGFCVVIEDQHGEAHENVTGS